MGILEQIREIEEEIRKTQKNKATEKHLGLLKAKLAKLRERLYSSSSKGGGGGFAPSKAGDATVAMIGFPSVGKSSLLAALTNAESKAAHYAFTTVTVVPGMLHHKGARIQLLDLPGIIEGASRGKGRGREVISVARNADLLLFVLEPFNAERAYRSLLSELYAMGFRVNERPADVSIEKRLRGGVEVVRGPHGKGGIEDETIEAILHEYGIHNALVTVREPLTAEQLIDAIEGNRRYVRGVVAVNKVDLADEEERKRLRRTFPDAVFVSTKTREGIEELKDALFKALSFIRVYTKPLGGEKSEEPMMLREGATVREACRKIHRDLERNFRYALVWGPSAKFPGQRVGLDHRLKDGDVITIVARK